MNKSIQLVLFLILNRRQPYLTVYILQCTLLSHGGKVKDEHISLLINAGLLVSELKIMIS